MINQDSIDKRKLNDMFRKSSLEIEMINKSMQAFRVVMLIHILTLAIRYVQYLGMIVAHRK